MDLSALLAREGIEPGDVEALLKWAKQRSHALIARIEPGSPLAELLAGNHHPSSGRTPEVNAPASHPATRNVPRPIARSVSRPYLNAAVEAALSGKQQDLELAIETAAAEVEPVPPPPVLEASPEPEPPPLEDDPSIGGFNRFAFSLRRRPAEPQPEEPPPRSSSLSRGFELHAESQAPRAWDDEHVPEPPGFEARLGDSARMHLANLDAESSEGLVLGIPDDDSDIPVFRGRPRSDAITADSSSSGLTDAAFDALIEPSDLQPVPSELSVPEPATVQSATPHRDASGPVERAASGPGAPRPAPW